MRHIESYEVKNQEMNEGFGTNETTVIKELKADLDRLVKQNVTVTDFSTNKFEQREKRLDEILHDLSFIVARYADITEDGDFIAKPLNEIQ